MWNIDGTPFASHLLTLFDHSFITPPSHADQLVVNNSIK
jgi:hypothetical protein